MSAATLDRYWDGDDAELPAAVAFVFDRVAGVERTPAEDQPLGRFEEPDRFLDQVATLPAVSRSAD